MKKLVTTLAMVLALVNSSRSAAPTEGSILLNNYDANFTVNAVGGAPAATFYWQVVAGPVSGALLAITSLTSGLNINGQDATGFFDQGIGHVSSVLGGVNVDV